MDEFLDHSYSSDGPSNTKAIRPRSLEASRRPSPSEVRPPALGSKGTAPLPVFPLGPGVPGISKEGFKVLAFPQIPGSGALLPRPPEDFGLQVPSQASTHLQPPHSNTTAQAADPGRAGWQDDRGSSRVSLGTFRSRESHLPVQVEPSVASVEPSVQVEPSVASRTARRTLPGAGGSCPPSGWE